MSSEETTKSTAAAAVVNEAEKKPEKTEDEVSGKLAAEEDNENEEEIVNMIDVLKDQEAAEARASEVPLGEDDCCTYSEGYVTQPLMACLTCYEKTKKMAGVCFGCGEKCHEGHNIVELWEKRNFKCDCGNSKFPEGFKCCFDSSKDSENVSNKYSQNFEGKFCYCGSSDDEKKQFIQCFTCQDWFHDGCLNNPPPKFAQFFCKNCVLQFPFLAWADQNQKNEEAQQESGEKNCKLGDWKKEDEFTDVFLESTEWQKLLCKCADCLEKYKILDLEYLQEKDDEDQNKSNKTNPKKRKSLHDAGMEALTKLPASVGLEMSSQFNNLKEKLYKDLFANLAASNKVVEKEDVLNFFENLKHKKPRRQ